MRTVLRHCGCCGDEHEFEVPPCRDGHDVDCPELACVDCGDALFAGALLLGTARPRLGATINAAA
jgi:hypothetical protein